MLNVFDSLLGLLVVSDRRIDYMSQIDQIYVRREEKEYKRHDLATGEILAGILRLPVAKGKQDIKERIS